MNETAYIGEAARQLGVIREPLPALERVGNIPPARRDFNGRIYTEFGIAQLRSMVMSSKPREARRRLEKEVKQKWLIEALKKEQLVRKREDMSKQEDTKTTGGGGR
jgi:DNA-binding transcriptional MerR regulator